MIVRKVLAAQKVECLVSSISKLQEHSHEGFRQSWKLWQNLCLLRWLRPKQRGELVISSQLVQKYCIYYSDLDEWKIVTYFWALKLTMKFPTLISNQLKPPVTRSRMENRMLETDHSIILSQKIFISCSACFIFWNQINQIIWSFLPHYLKHTT